MNGKDVREISDAELRFRLKALAGDERATGADLLVHLSEYDARKLYIRDGLGNLWQYCRRVLRFSEAEIDLRIQSARVARANPKLLDALRSGETTISAIGRLAPHLKGDNRDALIEEAKGKSFREVKQIVARESVSARIMEERKSTLQSTSAAPGLFDAVPSEPAVAPTPEECSEAVRRENPDRVDPVSGTDFKVAFVANDALIRDLEEVRNLLARRFPDARLEDVLGACLRMILGKFRPASRPRPANASGQRMIGPSRPAIPTALRAAVLARDEYRCTFEGPEGRCPENRRLELDHVVPKARGGPDTLENLRAMCSGHNRFLARIAFGAEFVEAAIARRRGERGQSGGGAGDRTIGLA